ncbi:MAG: hypothetical protein ACREPT_04580, partial [Rudaea sp.]
VDLFNPKAVRASAGAVFLVPVVAGELVYIAPSRVYLQLTEERWPGIVFAATREHASAVEL